MWDNIIFELVQGKMFSPFVSCLPLLYITYFNFSFYDVKVWNHFKTNKMVIGSKIQICKPEMSQKIVF